MQGGLYPCPYIEPSFAMPRVNASSGVVFIIAHSIQFRAGWETDALNFPGPFFLWWCSHVLLFFQAFLINRQNTYRVLRHTIFAFNLSIKFHSSMKINHVNRAYFAKRKNVCRNMQNFWYFQTLSHCSLTKVLLKLQLCIFMAAVIINIDDLNPPPVPCTLKPLEKHPPSRAPLPGLRCFWIGTRATDSRTSGITGRRFWIKFEKI